MPCRMSIRKREPPPDPGQGPPKQNWYAEWSPRPGRGSHAVCQLGIGSRTPTRPRQTKLARGTLSSTTPRTPCRMPIRKQRPHADPRQGPSKPDRHAVWCPRPGRGCHAVESAPRPQARTRQIKLARGLLSIRKSIDDAAHELHECKSQTGNKQTDKQTNRAE